MPKEVVIFGLLLLGGFLVGGAYSMWKTAKIFAIVLLVAAALAVAGAVLRLF